MFQPAGSKSGYLWRQAIPRELQWSRAYTLHKVKSVDATPFLNLFLNVDSIASLTDAKSCLLLRHYNIRPVTCRIRFNGVAAVGEGQPGLGAIAAGKEQPAGGRVAVDG